MFSKACEYAIKILIFVAQQSKDGKRISIKHIAQGIHSPEHFTAKILQELSRKGFVQSIKGPNGGFYMDANQVKTSLADIVKAMDGDRLFVGCGLGLKACSASRPCPIHHEFQHIKNNIKHMLEHSTIQMFIENLDLKLTFLKY